MIIRWIIENIDKVEAELTRCFIFGCAVFFILGLAFFA